jgi:hypothetical protein
MLVNSVAEVPHCTNSLQLSPTSFLDIAGLLAAAYGNCHVPGFGTSLFLGQEPTSSIFTRETLDSYSSYSLKKEGLDVGFGT